MSAKAKTEKTSGRPRSAVSEQAILAAAWRLLQQRPVKDVSIEAIAREAGVGKTTIYRWWPSKAAVFVDAFLAKFKPQAAFIETELAADALAQQMAAVVKVFSGEAGRIVAEIIAEGQSDSVALESFCDRFLQPRRQAAQAVIEQGIQLGEFDPDLDLEVALDILYGPIYYRLLVKHQPLDSTFAAKLSNRALQCLSH
ncbi:putative HTH-type transcriptional regulator [Acaryochloris thomasi RCC1774]|uniref:Putative HTH-type transcriptional regulator n=1 Tax=Acaryochloris thomasi RCC1774 TaxID=1764569 RepID=A0A2W1JYN7_9CYAN|nr:TetR/AcrR family transcriptional regulator [Acaryochloris thomasi]PZD73307.1 putative HTH-type transcriptional regulator [Acaryochloris thomasi RCC1774]